MISFAVFSAQEESPALPSLFTVMEFSCATVSLGFCKSKTSAEANSSDTLAQNTSRERVAEGDSESD